MSIERWGWAAVMLTTALAIVLGAYLIVLLIGFDSSQHQATAAWVQAIGAIGAIAAGFVGIHHQLQAQKHAAIASEQRQHAGIYGQILLMAQQAIEAAERLEELLSPEAFERCTYGDVSTEVQGMLAKRVLLRIESIAGSTSDLMRSGALRFDHVNMLLRLQRSLHSITEQIAGVENPLSDLSPVDVDLADIVAAIKTIRFEAGSAASRFGTFT